MRLTRAASLLIVGLDARFQTALLSPGPEQYFDHFLKGAPAPDWMVKGIPYIERDKEKEKYKATADVKEKSGN